MISMKGMISIMSDNVEKAIIPCGVKVENKLVWRVKVGCHIQDISFKAWQNYFLQGKEMSFKKEMSLRTKNYIIEPTCNLSVNIH